MKPRPMADPFVFRALPRLYVITSIFGIPFLALDLFVGITRGDWSCLGIVTTLVAPIYCLLAWLRFDIDAEGFRYRGPMGRVRVKFTDIARGHFSTMRSSHAPQGAAFFFVQLHDGRSVNTRIRCFPIRAAAWLLTSLEHHGIPIDVPETWSAKRMHSQMRTAREKLDEETAG